MPKVQITGKDLKVLAEQAIKNGTGDAWISIALEWIEYADAEIERLENLLNNLKSLRS